MSNSNRDFGPATCAECDGSGRTSSETYCAACHGQGFRSGNEDTLFFYDKDDKISVGEVPFSEIKYLPRVGDIVSLPKIEGAHYGGYYKVTHLIHSFVERGVNTGETFLLGITAYVQEVKAEDMPRRAIDE
jgi:hypothetical protein